MAFLCPRVPFCLLFNAQEQSFHNSKALFHLITFVGWGNCCQVCDSWRSCLSNICRRTRGHPGWICKRNPHHKIRIGGKEQTGPQSTTTGYMENRYLVEYLPCIKIIQLRSYQKKMQHFFLLSLFAVNFRAFNFELEEVWGHFWIARFQGYPKMSSKFL